MRPILVFLLIASAVCVNGTAFGQIIEFDPPGEFTLVPDRLVVSFTEAVSEQAARQLVEDAGYPIERAEFHSVIVRAAADSAFSQEHAALLRALPFVTSYHQQDMLAPDPRDRNDPLRVEARRQIRSIEDENFDESTAAAVEVVFYFEPETTREEARATVQQIPGLFIRGVEKRPSTMVIVVEEEDQARAIEVLEKSPLVRYVANLPEPAD